MGRRSFFALIAIIQFLIIAAGLLMVGGPAMAGGM